MVRINLFDPVRPVIYGTATAREIIEVCLVAFGFTLAVSAVFFAVTHLLG
jgi:hypothetical protein